MIFSCGLTYEEQGKQNRLKAEKEARSRRIFAWLPKTVEGSKNGKHQCVWLDWVLREGEVWQPSGKYSLRYSVIYRHYAIKS
jgi:hypothetical protein